MNPQDLIIRRISLNRFVNERVVKYVASHPFLFTKGRMADPLEDRPIRIKYFGVFQQKKTANKENVRKLNEVLQLVRFNGDHYVELMGKDFSTKEEIITYILVCFNSGEIARFEEVYNTVVNNKREHKN